MGVGAMESDVLADLFSRAGASDQDREAWLAERRQGITATQVRDLRIRAISSDALCAQKLGWEPEPDLANVKRIAYGKTQEPVIADAMRGQGYIAESRVFHHAENTRYLASPDGLRVHPITGELELLEVKTDEHDIANNVFTWADTGYVFQAQWLMFVTGAVRVRFVIQQCAFIDGEYQPTSDIDYRDVERDEDLIASLRALADSLLAKLDDYAAHGRPAAGMALVADAIRAEAEAKAARAAAEEWFASTGCDSLKVPGVGSASYAVSAPRRSLDQTALKAAHPALAEEFTRVTAAAKPTFRLTPARTKKEAI